MRPRVKLLALAVALALAWLGYRQLAPDSTSEDSATKERGPEPHGPRRMVYRDGTWVPLDLRELSAVLDDAFTHVPGLKRVSGRILEGESGEPGDPIPGAEVVFANEFGENSAIAADDGHYELLVQPGFYHAFARADGYVAVGNIQFDRLPQSHADASAVGLPRDELAPLLAVFRDQAHVDMHLRGGARIVGTVRDSAGRAIAGAIVRGQLAGFQNYRTRLILGTDMDESDSSGSFALDVPAGAIELSASHRDFAALKERSFEDGGNYAFVEPGEVKRMDLTLTEGCILEGTVIDARGELVAEGSLETESGSPPPNDFIPIGRISGGHFRYARTDAVTFLLRAWPWKSPPSEPQSFTCSNGARFSNIVFQIADAAPDVEGTLITQDGTPVPGAYIDVQPLEFRGMAQQEHVDAQGEWAFYALPPGRYQLLAQVPEYGVAARIITVPARGITLTLGGTGAISGTIRGMDQGVFEFIIERCESRGQEGGGGGDGDSIIMFDALTMPRSTRLVPVENGAFHISDLPACKLHAQAKTPRGSQAIRIDIQSGGTASLDLELGVEREVPGGVLDDETEYEPMDITPEQ